LRVEDVGIERRIAAASVQFIRVGRVRTDVEIHCRRFHV